MEYNEYDDYGTGWEEAAEAANDRREEAAIHGLRYPDEAILAFVAKPRCDCEKGGSEAAIDALLTGRCRRCGWRA